MVAHTRLALSCAVLTTLFATCAPALAAKELPAEAAVRGKQLEPLGPWNLDYGKDRCQLGRIFGAEDDRHYLAIKQAWPSDTFSLTLAGSSFKRYRRGARAEIGFQSDAPLRRLELPPMGVVKDIGPAVILSTVRLDAEESDRPVLDENRPATDGIARPTQGLDLSEGAKIERVVLKRGGRAISFETGNLQAAFEALNTCTKDLLKDWGLDPEKHQSFVPAKWHNSDEVVRRIVRDYPEAALNSGKQAIFEMRVIIDESGAVAECVINAATITDSLESPACKAMESARFSPALDSDGKPMRSYYANRIVYRINESPRRPSNR